jgi:hypothetical protein
MEKYRFDHAYGSVYKYSNDQKAYVFIGKLNGRTEKQFIEDYENRPVGDEDE